ncbi:uncharacterized protein RAG0_12650 [Rhynchosporium agropyri]|uniref:Uncharacterized protein n=1 Tax=Rhynchosporium agropyri TaxID=914238 RepID=A0A1E1L9K0_9HELO|nr:uncharacterized protein RAG0_12650 [Rhynchosporium agropyri]
MPPSKRNRGATLARSPPGSPIRPITKRPRQKTPELAPLPLLLPQRPIRATTTSMPTTFNSSQVDELETEEEEEEVSARVISESDSEESESEEEDDITQANEYLDQDLKELGLDRLDKEDNDQSDIEKEVSEEFKYSSFFRQSIIEGEVTILQTLKTTSILHLLIPVTARQGGCTRYCIATKRGSYKSKLAPLSEKGSMTQKRAKAARKELNRQILLQKSASSTKSTTQQSLITFFTPRPPSPSSKVLLKPSAPELILPLSDDSDISFTDDLSDDEFDQIVEEELQAEDKSIELDDLNDIEFLNSGRRELLLDSLIGDSVTLEQNTSTLKTYREVLITIKEELGNKRLTLLPQIRFEYSLIQQYVQNILKKSPRRGRIEASLLVAESNHPTGDGKTLARKIRALNLYYRTFGYLPIETRGGKQKNRSYLDNQDVFRACRTWLLAQKLATVTPTGFRYALNSEIMPRLLASAKKSKKSLLGNTTGTRKQPGKRPKSWKPLSKTATYKWLNRLGFHATEEKKGVYVDGHEMSRTGMVLGTKTVLAPEY